MPAVASALGARLSGGRTATKRDEKLDAVARERLAAVKQQIADSLKAVQSRKPLDAEPDRARKVRRLQAVTGLPKSKAEGVVAAAYGNDAGGRPEDGADTRRAHGRRIDPGPYRGLPRVEFSREGCAEPSRSLSPRFPEGWSGGSAMPTVRPRVLGAAGTCLRASQTCCLGLLKEDGSRVHLACTCSSR